MNAKKCKTIRQQLRAKHINPSEAEYVGGINRQPSVLRKNCGRARYKQFKSDAT